MDRITELTDAYVEVLFANLDPKRTLICKRTLNPLWNEDFRFEVVDDSDLQNEPLEIKIMDYDQLSYNDAIGSIFIDLNPLLTQNSGAAQVSGWFPIYDSLLGLRGQLHAQIKVQFFGNINPCKDSSAAGVQFFGNINPCKDSSAVGVQFYSTPSLPPGLRIATLLNFVSALENKDDPEYHWADNFRTPRKSNDSRTRLMYQLSGHVRRLLGKKVLDMNGNAVLGYKQYFDLETDTKTITVRAIGTAVLLSSSNSSPLTHHHLSPYSDTNHPLKKPSFTSPVINDVDTSSGIPTPQAMLKESSEIRKGGGILEVPDILLLTSPTIQPQAQSSPPQDPILLTLTRFPEYSVIGTGGFVCAAAIKVLDNDERDIRDGWWMEVRDEIKSHARALHSTHVVGYDEQTSVIDDIIFLFCSGTAVVIDTSLLQCGDERFDTGTGESCIKTGNRLFADPVSTASSPEETNNVRSSQDSPFPTALSKCACCRKKYVPEVLLSTIEPPPELAKIGSHVLIEAHVCRQKKVKVGESGASDMSESIPFAQYDIHRQLMYKLRIYGMNAVFGLKIQISIGENIMTAIATGTAFYIKALPSPPALKVFRTLEVVDEEDRLLLQTQKKLMEQSEINRRKIERCLSEENANFVCTDEFSDNDSNDDRLDTHNNISRLDQKAVVVEIDDEQDEDLVLFIDDAWSDDFQLSNIDTHVDSMSTKFTTSQMVMMVKQNIIDPTHHPNRQLAMVFKTIYHELAFQMSFLSPCYVTGLSYTIDIPKSNCVQVCMTAMVHGNIDACEVGQEENEELLEQITPLVALPRSSLVAENQMQYPSQSLGVDGTEDDFSFENDDEIYQSREDNPNTLEDPDVHLRDNLKCLKNTAVFQRIELTPLSAVPNALTRRFLGRISLHFIKESNFVNDSGSGPSGIGGFIHIFMMEMIAVLKAHVLCLGGNAVVGYSLDQVQFTEPLKNQGYALITISGDVLEVEYDELDSNE